MSARSLSLTRRACGLALLAFGFYLVTTASTRPYGDGDYQLRLAQQIYEHGRLDVPGKSRRWLFKGPDGKSYTTFSLGVALSYGPSVLATRLAMTPENKPFVWPIVHRVSGALFGALSVALFYLLALQLGATERVARGSAVLLALGSSLWVYAHSDFAETYQTFALLLAICATIAAARKATLPRGLGLGAAWGALFLAKAVYYAIAPCALLYVVAAHWRDRRALVRLCAVTLLAGLPLAALAFGYNLLRTGELLNTGRHFDHFKGPFDGSLWVGLHGLLFSSGKSIFIFNPALLLALFGVRRLWRERRADAAFVLGSALILFLIYAKYIFWHGGWSWGPRFLVALVPLLFVPFITSPFVERARPRRVLAALVLVAGLSVGVQALGTLYYCGHIVHINNRARRAFLGKAPRDGCGWCHETLYLVHFVPQFSPLAVHWWLFKNRLTGASLKEAKYNAPWSRFFPEKYNKRMKTYQPKVDYWFLQWIAPYKSAGWKFLGLTLPLFLLGSALLSRRFRLPWSRGSPG